VIGSLSIPVTRRIRKQNGLNTVGIESSSIGLVQIFQAGNLLTKSKTATLNVQDVISIFTKSRHDLTGIPAKGARLFGVLAHPHSKLQNTKSGVCDQSVIAKMLVIEITPKINLSLKIENEIYLSLIKSSYSMPFLLFGISNL